MNFLSKGSISFSSLAGSSATTTMMNWAKSCWGSAIFSLKVPIGHHTKDPMAVSSILVWTGFGNTLPLMMIMMVLLASLGISAIVLLLIVMYARIRTRNMLVRCGLPTVYWTPKFINYTSDNTSTDIPPNNLAASSAQGLRMTSEQPRQQHQHNERKLASSNITNILPRMQRLQGPLGMYGTVYGISTPVVHVAHPLAASSILSSSSSSSTTSEKGQLGSGASKAPAYNHFTNFCGQGVFTADGLDWKAKRAAVLHALLRTSGGFEQLLEQEAHRAVLGLFSDLEQQQHIMTASSRSLGDQFSSSSGSNSLSSAGLQVEINVVSLLQRATLSLIYRYLTHTDMIPQDDDSLQSPLKQQPPQQQQRQEQNLVSYLESIVQIRMIILAQSRSIWFLLPRWCYRTFSSMFQEEERTMRPIRSFSTRACREARPGSPLAVLRDRTPLYQGPGRSPPNAFSKNLLDEAITLLFAGQDTSAATLSWTLHLVSLSPRVQDKLALEVKRVLADSQVGPRDILTKKVVSSMPYLDAVVKESMRLYPVAPFIVRKLTSPVEINYSADKDSCDSKRKVRLPAGAIACIWIYSLHRHPAFWAQPDEFLPERWLNANHLDRGVTEGAYMPFAMGPRNCLGQPLAHIVLRVLLARLIDRYEFQDRRLLEGGASAKLRKDMQAGFTVLPKGGLNLLISPRKKCTDQNA